jgi:aerobic-type carbon monoxide dehydrogenase small subunit (CoxS/CutS family)
MPRLSAETKHRVRIELNGRWVEGDAEPRMLLTDFLRHVVGATGTHVGCEHGVCGACTVMVDGAAVRACLMLAVQADGTAVVSAEGLAAPDGTLHPVQQAMQDEYGLQCGFCTPGIVITLAALTAEGRTTDAEELHDGLSGHLCRCTGYQGMLRVVRRLAAAHPAESAA